MNLHKTQVQILKEETFFEQSPALGPNIRPFIFQYGFDWNGNILLTECPSHSCSRRELA